MIFNDLYEMKSMYANKHVTCDTRSLVVKETTRPVFHVSPSPCSWLPSSEAGERAAAMIHHQTFI